MVRQIHDVDDLKALPPTNQEICRNWLCSSMMYCWINVVVAIGSISTLTRLTHRARLYSREQCLLVGAPVTELFFFETLKALPRVATTNVGRLPLFVPYWSHSAFCRWLQIYVRS